MTDEAMLHPEYLYQHWCMVFRDAYDHPDPDHDLTLIEMAAYLGRHLPRFAQDPLMDFDELAKDLKKCRDHLENVLGNSQAPERGVPCPDCTSESSGVGKRLKRTYGHWCEDEACEKMHYADDQADMWVCPTDRSHRWDHEAYTKYVDTRQAQRKKVRESA